MKISVLIENTKIENAKIENTKIENAKIEDTKSKNIKSEDGKSAEDLIAEHGLSFYIEYEDEKYILDFGQSGAFLENAKKLQIKLTGEETCILSHAHYDHAGGLGRFFDEHPNVKVYAMKSCFTDEYYSLSTGTLRHIGIPEEIIDRYRDNFILIEGVTKLSDNVYLVPHSEVESDRRNRMARAEKSRLFRKGEALEADDFSHELTAVFRSEKGLWIINSCSHAGVEEVVKEVRSLFPDYKIYAYVGGLHMQARSVQMSDMQVCNITNFNKQSSDSIYSGEQIESLATYINSVGIEKIYTGHCTGDYALTKLKEYLGDAVETITTGSVIE